MSENVEADGIQKQMSRIRFDLDENVEKVVEQTKEMVDWRSFARRHPWLTAGAAATLGYLMIPQRLRIISPDADTLAKLAKQNKLVVKPKPDVRKQAGVVAPVVNFVAAAAMRSLVHAAGQHFGRLSSTNESDLESSQNTTGD